MSHKVIPTNSGSTKRKDKIPEYAKDFRKEWLYIRGINKKCDDIFHIIKLSKSFKFNSSPINKFKCIIKKFLKDQECGKFKDISGFYFDYSIVCDIGFLISRLNDYFSLCILPYSLEINEECNDFFIDNHFPGYKELLELVNLINDKIKKEEPNIFNIINSYFEMNKY